MCAVPSDECPDTVADFWELLVFLGSAQELLEWLLTVNSQFCCRVSARVRPGIVIEEMGIFQLEATIYFTSSRPGSPELSVDPVQSMLNWQQVWRGHCPCFLQGFSFMSVIKQHSSVGTQPPAATVLW